MNSLSAMQEVWAAIAASPGCCRLLAVSVEVAVLAVAVWCLIRVLRIRSARVCSLLWILVLAKGLFGLAFGAPLEVGALRLTESARTSQSATAAMSAEDLARQDAEMQRALREAEAAASASVASAPNRTDATQPSSPAVGAQRPRPSTPSVLSGVFASLSRFSLAAHAAGLLTAAWLAGVVWALLATALDLRRIRGLARASGAPSEELLAAFRSEAARLGIARVPALSVCAEVESPALAGFLRPTVLAPAWLAETADPDQLRWMLAHELMHYKQKDAVGLLVRRAAQVALWFHPAVWWAGRQWEEAMERACDRALIAGEADARHYAEQLHGVLKSLMARRSRTRVVTGLFATRTQIGKRIAALLTDSLAMPARLSPSSATLLVLAALAAFSFGIGVHRPAPAQEPVGVAKPLALGEAILSGHVSDQSGRPIAGASVQPQPDSRDLPYPRSVRTDALGVYVFDEALQPGKYHLSVQAAGFIGIQTTPTMPVVDLQPLSKLVKDFALPQACRAELLTTDEAGNPLQGVRLSVAVVSVDGILANNGIPEVQSDAQGKALLDGVPPIQGKYQVTAMHAGFAPARATLKMADPKTTYTATIAMIKGVAVKGRAICEDGQPAAGWSISAQPDWWNSLTLPKPSPIGDNGDFTLDHIVPGKYAIEVLVPEKNGSVGHRITTMQLPPESGTLELKIPLASPKSAVAISGTVSIPGHEIESAVEVDVVADNPAWGHQRIGRGESDFTLSNLKPGVYDLRFQSAEAKDKTIHGVQAPTSGLKVELEWVGKPKLRGVAVVAATSQPFARFKTRVRKVKTLSGPGYTGDVQWHEVADSQGRFEVDLVGPGVYKVEAAADGFAPLWSADYNSDLDSTKTLTLALTPGATLRGRVQDEQGKAVAGAKVIPLSLAGGGWGSDAYGFASEEGATVSAADGTFSFAHLPPGTETLKAVHTSYCLAVARDIELKEGATTPETPVVLTQGGAVAGRIYDAQGKPQAGVTLVVRDVSGQPRELEACRLAVVTSGADGSYRAEHLPDRPCYIQRSDEMVYDGVVHRAILPAAGQTLPLDFGGASGQSDCVRGRLLVDDKPEAGRHVGVYGDSSYYGGFVSRVTADEKGEFALYGVPPGRWSLYVEKSAGHFDWPKARTFEVSPAMETERGTLDLGDVTPPARRVVVRLGAALAQLPPESIGDMWVVAPEGDSPGGRGVGQVDSRREKGAPLVVTELCPGHYKASASAGGTKDRVQFFQSFDLKEGEKELVVTLGPSSANATVTGKSSLKEDRPIVLMSQDKCIMAVAQSEGGHYRLGNLPAGEYLFLDSTRDMARPIRRLTLAEGETATVDVGGPEWDRPEPAGLGVTVFTAAGQMLPGAQLWIEGQGTTRRPTNERDIFSNFMTAPGNYVLHVAFPGYREAQQNVTIPPPPAGEPYYQHMRQVRVRLEVE